MWFSEYFKLNKSVSLWPSMKQNVKNNCARTSSKYTKIRIPIKSQCFCFCFFLTAFLPWLYAGKNSLHFSNHGYFLHQIFLQMDINICTCTNIYMALVIYVWTLRAKFWQPLGFGYNIRRHLLPKLFWRQSTGQFRTNLRSFDFSLKIPIETPKMVNIGRERTVKYTGRSFSNVENLFKFKIPHCLHYSSNAHPPPR